jgi:hypothetical protein
MTNKTKITKKVAASLLKESKEYLLKELNERFTPNGGRKTYFICCALGIAAQQKPKGYVVLKDALCSMIEVSLGSDIASEYLRKNKFATAKELRNKNKLQEWRHQWVDHMIKELEEGNLWEILTAHYEFTSKNYYEEDTMSSFVWVK